MNKFILVVLAIMLCSSAFCADIDALKKQAEQGDANAQAALGFAYYDGTGFPKDYNKAVNWWRKAAGKGYTNAQTALGYAYSKGTGVPQDYNEAVNWWRKAAEQGDANAQGVLGAAYFDGTGAPQDYAEAYFWLDLASRKDAIYTKWRDMAVAELTPGKIEEVQARCTKWLEDFEKRKR